VTSPARRAAARAKRRFDTQRFRRKLDASVRDSLAVPIPAAFARFGRGSIIVPPARVNSPECIDIGDDVILLEQAWLAVFPQPNLPPPRLTIGAHTRIGRAAHIACVGEVTIGPEVLTSDYIYIADTYHGYEEPTQAIGAQPMAEPRPVRIERGAFLGIRSVVLRGVTVGENAYVAAGAVVVDDVPPRTVVVGNPARPVRRYDADRGEWVAIER
jgi:carbonic anhydrase/acetyltransferase-like protein (isoleucine patch superfamily)